MPGPNQTDRWAAGILSNFVVPAGLIVCFDDTSIPSGWTRFSAADDKHIIGAGSSYNVADTGGANTLTLSAKTSNSQGGHTGSSALDATAPDSGGGDHTGNSSAGSHSHDFTVSATTLEPDYRQVVLIKADSAQPNLPAKTLILWHNPAADPSGLTQQYTADDDKMVRAGSSITSGGDNTVESVTSTTSGSHQHVHTAGQGGGDGQWHDTGAGGHSHSVTLTATFNVKEVLLGLWTDAAAVFDLAANHIAMYENTTPPSGWYLCDGNNGTPDMRDYFLGVANNANQNTSQGDNTLTATHPSYSWSHGHRTTVRTVNETTGSYGYHHTETLGSHAHTLSLTDSDYIPAYYSLAFIMYGG